MSHTYIDTHTHKLSILAHGVEYMLDHIINETLSFAKQSNVGLLVMHRLMPLSLAMYKDTVCTNTNYYVLVWSF